MISLRRHFEGPNQVYCVWSGKPIPSEDNVYACALSPSLSAMYGENNIKPSMMIVVPSTVVGKPDTRILKEEVGFHVHKNYVNVLKQWHTLLRFLDYLCLEIEKEFLKVKKELTDEQNGWNAEADQLWNGQFAGKSLRC
jgi:hypothetical protein